MYLWSWLTVSVSLSQAIAAGNFGSSRVPAECELGGAISYPPPETLMGVQV